jgi:hypothetical protein
MAEFTENMLGTAAGTVGIPAEEIPLAMRMAGAAPGIVTAGAFMSFRGANTLIEGGRFDYRKSRDPNSRMPGKGRTARIQEKFRVLDESGKVTGLNVKQYYGGSGTLLRRRAESRVAAGKGSTFNLRASVASFKPGAARRHGSLTSFLDPSAGMYSPYAAAPMISKFGPVRNKMAGSLGKMGVATSADETLMGPGLLSFISAGTKADRLERKALGGNQRALSKLQRVDDNIRFLAGQNNPSLVKPKILQGPTTGPTLKQTNQLRWAQRGGMDPSQYMDFNKVTSISYGASSIDDAMGSAVRARVNPAGVTSVSGQVGVRSDLLVSSMPGKYGQMIGGYFQGAKGLGQNVAGDAGKAGVAKAAQHLASTNLAPKAMVMGAKYAALAIPGLNILGAAMLAYDLGNMAGQVFKSGVNLARDAAKSMQGSIHKPLFGMGYKDTEAAATSRQRGVMAIQNSRLNARSMLGSEAGMLSAHFG